MAENKKSFVLYADLIKSIEHLTNEEKGILFNHLLEYVNDKNPVLEDRLVLTAWKPIELQLKRDLVKFEKSKDEKSLSGRIGNLKRWNNDLYNQFISKELTIEEAEEIANSRKVSQPDKVQSQPIAKIAVNDNVNVNVINNNTSTKVDKINFDVLLEYINNTLSKKYVVISDKAKKSFNARLKDGYTKAQIMLAIQNVKNDSFHKENNYKHATVEYFSRAKTLDMHGQELKQQSTFSPASKILDHD